MTEAGLSYWQICPIGKPASRLKFANQAMAHDEPFIHTFRMGKNHRKHYFKEWRDFRDLTLERAADRAEMSLSTLSRIETYVRPFRQDHLYGLAFAYNCEPWELLGKNPYIQDADVVDIMRRIPSEDRAKALRALEVFLPDKTGT